MYCSEGRESWSPPGLKTKVTVVALVSKMFGQSLLGFVWDRKYSFDLSWSRLVGTKTFSFNSCISYHWICLYSNPDDKDVHTVLEQYWLDQWNLDSSSPPYISGKVNYSNRYTMESSQLYSVCILCLSWCKRLIWIDTTRKCLFHFVKSINSTKMNHFPRIN